MLCNTNPRDKTLAIAIASLSIEFLSNQEVHHRIQGFGLYLRGAVQWVFVANSGPNAATQHRLTVLIDQLARRARQAHYAKVIDKRIEAINSATALTIDEGVIALNVLLVRALGRPVAGDLKAIAEFDQQITERAHTHPDFALFDALPCAATVLAPRLLIAFGEQRERYASATEMQKYAGVAPVTERTGKISWVHRRWHCSTILRQTFVEWSALSIHYSFWARVYYQQQRDKGKSHQVAGRRLRSNGSESSFVAGKRERPTMNRFISTRWPAEVHHLSIISQAM